MLRNRDEARGRGNSRGLGCVSAAVATLRKVLVAGFLFAVFVIASASPSALRGQQLLGHAAVHIRSGSASAGFSAKNTSRAQRAAELVLDDRRTTVR